MPFSNGEQRRRYFAMKNSGILNKLGNDKIIDGKQFILPDGTITTSCRFHQNALDDCGYSDYNYEHNPSDLSGDTTSNFLKQTGAVRSNYNDHENVSRTGTYNIEAHHELTPDQLAVIKQHLKETRIKGYDFGVDDMTADEVVNTQLKEKLGNNFKSHTLPKELRNNSN